MNNIERKSEEKNLQNIFSCNFFFEANENMYLLYLVSNDKYNFRSNIYNSLNTENEKKN